MAVDHNIVSGLERKNLLFTVISGTANMCDYPPEALPRHLKLTIWSQVMSIR
jgi:hypothetical protein